jgi:acyl-CoA thioesterase-2
VTEPAHQQTFADRIALQQIDRDIFTGWCHSGAPLRAYGGQIAAQSLNAAGRTIDDRDRYVHSLHGYFLRPGGTKDSITYLVDRPRDGRSFSTRIVRAVQQGETIFMMTASFASREDGPEHQAMPPETPPPDDHGIVFPALASQLTDIEQRRALDFPGANIIDLRVDGADRELGLVGGRYERMAWVRIREDLPDDWLNQACALTYLSDLTMVSTALAPHRDGLEANTLRLASIDHAMWFHGTVHADRWLLFAQDTPVARGGHGLARGLFYDLEGQLVASVVQESLMRTRRPAAPG